jgi:integrase
MTPQPDRSPMPTHNPENERIKRRYFAYLKEAKRRGEPSVDAAAKALNRFELDTRFRSFKTFHPEQAVAFKRHLAEQTNARTGKPLAKATIHSTLAALKAFFVWLAGQTGYRSRLSYSDADYFNLSDRDSRIARTRLDKSVPSLEQVRHVIETMPANHAIQRRDRALVAFILLTGARDGAVASLKLKHIDLTEGCVVQDAREVATKFGKTFTPASFRLATMFGGLWKSGSSTLRLSCIGDRTIRFFRQPEWRAGWTRPFGRSGLSAATGRRPIRSGWFSDAPSTPPTCRTFHPIGCGSRWCSWASACARHRSSSRHGARTLGTAAC